MSDTPQCHNLGPGISLDLIRILPDPANIRDLRSTIIIEIMVWGQL